MEHASYHHFGKQGELYLELKDLERKIDMYEKYWRIKIEKTPENTLRIYFYGIHGSDKSNLDDCASIDQIFADELLLANNANPMLKNIVSIQDQFNQHRRLDLFVCNVRNEFFLNL